MSHWTYVSGIVRIRLPFETVRKDRLVDYVNWSLHDMEKRGFNITGSEGPIETSVYATQHPSSYSSDNADGYDNGVITVIGSLRDREFDETARETKAFLKALARYVDVEEVLLRVNDVIFDEQPYGKLYDFNSENYDKLEAKRDQLYRIRLMNKFKYFDQYLTLEHAAEIMEVLRNLGPKTMDGMLNNFGFDRVIDWDFNDHHEDWMKREKIAIPTDVTRKDIDDWFRKRKYPKKLSLEAFSEKLDDLVYGHKQERPVTEQEFFRQVRTYISHALANEDIRKEVEKWG